MAIANIVAPEPIFSLRILLASVLPSLDRHRVPGFRGSRPWSQSFDVQLQHDTRQLNFQFEVSVRLHDVTAFAPRISMPFGA